MIIPGLLTNARLFISLVIELAWLAFATTLDFLVSASALQAAMTIATLIGLLYGTALAMQRETNKKLDNPKQPPINPFLLEIRFSFIGIFFRFLSFLINLPLRILRALLKAFVSDDENSKEEARPPLLVPTLGPSYLWAALITAGIFVLSLAAEPLIRWQLDAPRHFPTWQYLFFGHRPELAPFLPLDTYPSVAAVVLSTFWLLLWFTTARIVRLAHFDFIGRNIIADVDNPQALPSWRTHFAVSNLAEKDPSYAVWAKWLPLVAIPLLLLAYLSLSGDPYRLNASAFALALVAWTAWVLHLKLEGIYRPEEPQSPEAQQKEAATAAGWIDVLNDLRRLHNIRPPAISRPLRDVETLAFSQHSLSDSELLSPLLAELLPEPGRLTAMQHDVMTHLSRHSFVHIDPPADTRTLELGAGDQATASQLRHRNQIIIAPEGSGKTTLGMLAAFNNALIHTGSTLVVVRNADVAQRTASTFKGLVRPSTLRWNLRIRRLGGSLIEDLASGIIPDLLVCDLQELVTTLLDDVETYRPFLSNLSLIVVDDLETFCGPVEVHAQLAFRRLELRLRALRGVDEISASNHTDTPNHSPIFLLLASETMDDLPAWARSLCGIDAVPRYFASQYAASRRERARADRRDVEKGGRSTRDHDENVEMTADGRRRTQLIYDLQSFSTPSGKPLRILDIIEACEALAVPWHFRPVGDNRRLLGRSVLPLRDEPQIHVDDPLRAAVIFLDGHASDVERELLRLHRAGAKFSSRATPPQQPEEIAEEENQDQQDQQDQEIQHDEIEPIALITIVDPTERLAIATANHDERLSDLQNTFPRPFLRPPSGYLTRRHLTSELSQHWTEVADLLDVFGNEIAPLLRNLTRQGALLLDPRTTLRPGRNTYEKRVYLRGIDAELSGGNPDTSDDSNRLLPPPVEDVEVAARHHVAIRERTTLVQLGRVDAESARHRFYPGRIFETDRGRHVVVAYAGDSAETQRVNSSANHPAQTAFEVGDIIAEPFLGEEITSPRRQIKVDLIASSNDALTPQPRFLGEAPIGVGLFPVKCRFQHQATFRLHPQTAEIRQRIYRSEHDRRAPSTLQTRALGLFPALTVDGRPPGAPLPLNAARQIAAALRAVLPLIYRGANSAVAVALHLSSDSPTLSATDAFFLFDLHNGGNGASRAIERDGIAPLLRLAHHLLSQLRDTRRLLALHDEFDGPLTDDERQQARHQALTWFASHLDGVPQEPEA